MNDRQPTLLCDEEEKIPFAPLNSFFRDRDIAFSLHQDNPKPPWTHPKITQKTNFRVSKTQSLSYASEIIWCPDPCRIHFPRL